MLLLHYLLLYFIKSLFWYYDIMFVFFNTSMLDEYRWIWNDF